MQHNKLKINLEGLFFITNLIPGDFVQVVFFLLWDQLPNWHVHQCILVKIPTDRESYILIFFLKQVRKNSNQRCIYKHEYMQIYLYKLYMQYLYTEVSPLLLQLSNWHKVHSMEDTKRQSCMTPSPSTTSHSTLQLLWNPRCYVYNMCGKKMTLSACRNDTGMVF